MPKQYQGGIPLERLPSSRGCFVCGQENPVGLKVQFERTPEGVRTVLRPGPAFQGFDGVVQGGVSAGLMDDAMWYAIFGATGVVTMTAELTVRYKAPVPIETELTVTASLVEQRRALYTCKAAIHGPGDQLLAEASGKFLPAPRTLAERLTQQLS